MNIILQLFAVLFIALGGIVVLLGTLFSFVGICGPVPDAWVGIVGGALLITVGLLIRRGFVKKDH